MIAGTRPDVKHAYRSIHAFIGVDTSMKHSSIRKVRRGWNLSLLEGESTLEMPQLQFSAVIDLDARDLLRFSEVGVGDLPASYDGDFHTCAKPMNRRKEGLGVSALGRRTREPKDASPRKHRAATCPTRLNLTIILKSNVNCRPALSLIPARKPGLSGPGAPPHRPLPRSWSPARIVSFTNAISPRIG